MSLKIRLSRAGAKKRPFYRVVVADTRSPRDGRFLERLGTYDPMLPKDHPERVRLNEERIRHWLGVGALPSDRVARFLGAAEIIPMPAQRNNPQKGQPRAKALERQAARAEKAKAAAEAEAETPPETVAEEAAPEEAAPEEAAPEEAAPEEAAAEEAPAEEAASEEAPADEAAADEGASAEAGTDDGEGEEKADG